MTKQEEQLDGDGCLTRNLQEAAELRGIEITKEQAESLVNAAKQMAVAIQEAFAVIVAAMQPAIDVLRELSEVQECGENPLVYSEKYLKKRIKYASNPLERIQWEKKLNAVRKHKKGKTNGNKGSKSTINS